ncbi:MAG: beta-ketoacyl synthase chain length factor [Achromobacter sp.]|uniref:beta-ketoacyl synthase chain length factor n=1 Tax=Achromobacter sp. TaxID=134375 RepID=UPI00299FB3B9|nr:beta-ketoacyl synthase chain length factor [Achromobacter sp.]MDX3985827.1 beta-ketoacyl synthase chain length factor [Achromobacter sp.]
MLTFSIAQWQGWTQGMESPEDWFHWAQHPYCPLDDARAPRLDFLPPMQRRRLSPLARAVFECAWPLAAGRPAMPFVFASRHGETTRNFGLLQALAADEPLSPTAFGLSVHNAIAAQWSIIRGETTESVALSVDDDGLEHAFVEAAMLLDQGHDDVLVVLAEERPPAPYAAWIDDVPYTYAAAFRLRAGSDWSLVLSSGAGGHRPPPTSSFDLTAAEHAWPNPLNLLRHLTLRTPTWGHANRARRWTWTRTA